MVPKGGGTSDSPRCVAAQAADIAVHGNFLVEMDGANCCECNNPASALLLPPSLLTSMFPQLDNWPHICLQSSIQNNVLLFCFISWAVCHGYS